MRVPLRPRGEVERAAVDRMFRIERTADAIDELLYEAPDPLRWSELEAAEYFTLRSHLEEACAPPPFRPPGHLRATRSC
jgi:hypothetical protein